MCRMPCGDCIDWLDPIDDNTHTVGKCGCPPSPHCNQIRLDTDDGCKFAFGLHDLDDGIEDHARAAINRKS